MPRSRVDRPPQSLERARFAQILSHLNGRRAAVFLDYDGTLTPIMARPELALLDPATRATLQRLSQSATVAVISGRSCADVKKLVRMDNIYYAGNHGLEIAGPEDTALQREFAHDYLDDVSRARDLLADQLRDIDNLLIEDKRFSLSVHYRLVDPDRIADIEQAVDDAVTRLPRLQKRPGKQVFELRPRFDWDKGKAVLWLLRTLGLDDDATVPIYIGDDATDEDAFRALRGRGIGIVVGDGRDSAARYALRDPGEVREFLEFLAARCGDQG